MMHTITPPLGCRRTLHTLPDGWGPSFPLEEDPPECTTAAPAEAWALQAVGSPHHNPSAHPIDAAMVSAGPLVPSGEGLPCSQEGMPVV